MTKKQNLFENDLTEGNVAKQLIKFCLPFLASNIIQSLYGVADLLIVGQFADTISMSGVNIGGQITFILTNLIVGLSTGGSVLIAQYLARGEREKMKKTISTLLTSLILSSIVITIVMLILKKPILNLIKTPADSFAEAEEYLVVTLIGLVFIFGYNALSSILRGMGDSKSPFIFVSIAAVTNIVLDLILVGVFDMRAFGAAIATVISQAMSLVLCVVHLKRNNFVFDFNIKSFVINKEQLSNILRVGLPTAVQNSVVSISFLFITSLVNEIGDVPASSAVGAITKFNGFAIMPAVAMSAAISTISAQNIGAGKWDRAIKTCKIGLGISFSISIAIFAFVQLFPELVLRIFNDDKDMIAYGVEYIRPFSFDYIFVPIQFCLNGMFVGAGHTLFSLINGTISSLLVRIPASYIFGKALNMGLLGVGLGAPIASAISLAVVIVFLISGKWKHNLIENK